MARRKGKTKWLCLVCFQAAKPQPRGKGALLSDIDGERRCVLCARPEAFEPVVHTLQEVRFDKVASTRLVRGLRATSR